MDSAARKNLRTFYLIVITQAFSLIGSRLSGLAVGFEIFRQTGQAAPLLLVSFFSVLPQVFAANIGGWLADRWDRRRLMLLSDVGQAICSLLLLISFASNSFQLWHLYVLTVLTQVLGSIQGSAFTASITMLVPESQRDRANGVAQLSGPAAGIIAPVISGIIYAAVGVVGTILIDLLTFLAAAVVFMAVRIPQPAETEIGRRANTSVLRSFTGGIVYLWEHRPLFALVLLFALVNFCIAGSMGMALPYTVSRTGSEGWSGLILGFSSAGTLAGGILMSVWGGIRPRIHMIMPSLIFSGVCLALLGTAQTGPALAAVVFFMGVPISLVNAPVMSIIQAKVPPDMQGRVFAVLVQIALVLTPLAYLLNAHLADNVLEPAVGTAAWQGLAPLLGNAHGAGMGLIYFVSGIIMAGSSALMYLWPMVRRMETTLPDYTPEPAPEERADDMLTPAIAPGD